jgi:hypothetical protein
LRYADDRGISTVVERMNELQTAYGIRFAPAGLLQGMEVEEKTFYGST